MFERKLKDLIEMVASKLGRQEMPPKLRKMIAADWGMVERVIEAAVRKALDELGVSDPKMVDILSHVDGAVRRNFVSCGFSEEEKERIAGRAKELDDAIRRELIRLAAKESIAA